MPRLRTTSAYSACVFCSPLAMRTAGRAVFLGVFLLLTASGAVARPGGGNTYSGGGGGGEGSDEGLGALFQVLVWLCVENPAFGIPVTVLVVVGYLVFRYGGKELKSWSTSPADVVAAVGQTQRVRRPDFVPRSRIAKLRKLDPQFSVVLFEDFVYMLYAAFQRARATGVGPLAAYVASRVGQHLPDPRLADVRGIVIGAMRFVGFSGTRGPVVAIELEFDVNYVEVDRTGSEQRFYVVDRVRLERAATVQSRPPARSRTLDCPNCGAALEAIRGTQCTYCHQDVGYGQFDWNITAFKTCSKESRGPLLTGDSEEAGTEQPTQVEPGVDGRFQKLRQRDPSLTWDALTERIAYVWGELQVAWSRRDVSGIRPYVSDNLFQSLVYWIDLYTEQHCRNVNEQAEILRIDLANVIQDATYDAVTVRLFASGLDYTVSDDGRVLSGSRSRPRTYSEYWTLIRSSSRPGASRGNSNCPGCGAPLRVGMAGNCEYCKVKVTSGDFDWVLSRIEQDEAYTGID